ncbi:MAG: FGGY family carbohydrate kinase [Cytophagales bacterium]|nr:FGGY family carbohydrate kinase [Cytophagales bacterium]
MRKYLLGFDVGSSSVKAALVDATTQESLRTTFFPRVEMDTVSRQKGWAEQSPEVWWDNLCHACHRLLDKADIDRNQIAAIGISYQMHGLVLVDKDKHVLRPAIIWSDSRAVKIGAEAFCKIGPEKCLEHLLNSPGNFTLSKLKWVCDNEPQVYDRIHKFMLPGDYINMKLTGEINTTVSGLSEAILWDFKENQLADFILDYFGIDYSLVPNVVPTFGEQGELCDEAARLLGLPSRIPVTYRAGDQPNNALSLNVTEPGEVAATGGTSGVVYAVTDQLAYDQGSRVNSFAHVNHDMDQTRIGVLLCINGAGSQYSFMKNQVARDGTTYEDMERLISSVPISSEGLRVLPYGNGAERVLHNQEIGSHIINLQFNRHGRAHLYRAAIEGIAFSFNYGLEVLRGMGIPLDMIRVGNDNLFQSEVFTNTVAMLSNCEIEVVGTSGAAGAALAAGFGKGLYPTLKHAVKKQQVVKRYLPDGDNSEYVRAYEIWKSDLEKLIHSNSQVVVK